MIAPIDRPAATGVLAVVRRVLEAVLVVVSAAYAIIVLLQVFYRYVLNDSLVWAEEVIRYTLVWAIMLGSAIVAARGEDIRLDTIPSLLGARGRRRLYRVADATTLAFCGFLAWYGVEFMLRAGAARASASGLPMTFAYAAMPVGAVLIAVFVVDGWRRRPGSASPGPDANSLR